MVTPGGRPSSGCPSLPGPVAATQLHRGGPGAQGAGCWLPRLRQKSGEPRKRPTCLVVGGPGQVLAALAATGLRAVLEDPRAGQGLGVPARDHGVSSEPARGSPRGSPNRVRPHFLPWPRGGNGEHHTCVSSETPKHPILQRSRLRLRGTKPPAEVSGRVVLRAWLYLPPKFMSL